MSSGTGTSPRKEANVKRPLVFGLVLALVAVGLLATGTALAKKPVPPPPPKGDCNCPDVYAPVICSNGTVYSNLCQAGCAGATGCVPYGDVTALAAAGGCRCPLVYAPVICDNGKTYPNPCVANCHHAKNCVPTGDL